MLQISKATEYNWKKLNIDSDEKLTKRANKTLSQKRVVATSYLDYAPANMLLEKVMHIEASVKDIMYTLCVLCLKSHNIFHQKNVAEFMSQYSDCEFLDIEVPEGVWSTKNDVLGFIYQSVIPEGERNRTGQYYTSRKVVHYMLAGKCLADGETFLDPCCGSGAFLCGVNTHTPECLYGFDINPIAVLIAGTNLLVRYKDYNFVPHVYCLDFLKKDLFDPEGRDIPFRFDNIYTNPPWGSDKEGTYAGNFPMIRSKEKSSMVIVESLKRLKPNGCLYLLLPMSLLKIKSHSDVRRYILTQSTIQKIDLYSGRFDGVYTDYFSIKQICAPADSQSYMVTTGDEIRHIVLPQIDYDSGTIVQEQLSGIAASIVGKMESRRHDDLKHSRWALGIVTGDNQNKVKKEKAPGLEPVYTGKQVGTFNLLSESAYIHFDPESFQQCAKEEYFRAPEKLIYRFIAKYPIVAYDDEQCLCLNSANILIPNLDGISTKSVAALLNSSLYHFYYSSKFSDIKVLKGNLQELPFPMLTPEQDESLSRLVTSVRNSSYSEKHQRELDEIVYAIFDITAAEQQLIKAKIDGTVGQIH